MLEKGFSDSLESFKVVKNTDEINKIKINKLR